MKGRHIKKISKLIDKGVKFKAKTDNQFEKNSMKILIMELREMRKLLIKKDFNLDEYIEFTINQRANDLENFINKGGEINE